MNGWPNFCPFYRTLSPIGAAALLHIHVNNRILKQGEGTADHMMPRKDGQKDGWKDRWKDRRTDGRTDRRADLWKFTPECERSRIRMRR